jgi:hypothetical protein
MSVEQPIIKGRYGSLGSRAEMEKFEKELPAHVQEELRKGKLRYADGMIYSNKQISSNTIKMFETQDDREIGMRNIANAKLQKNQCFLLSGIQTYVHIVNPSGATPTKADLLNTFPYYVEQCPPLANGEFNLKANQKTIIPETSCKVFVGQGFTTGYPAGYYKLHNPRLITDEVLIEFTFELGTWAVNWKNFFVFVGLHGTITTP